MLKTGESLDEMLGEWLWEDTIYPVDEEQRRLTESIIIPSQELVTQELNKMREDFDRRIKRVLKRKKHRSPYYYKDNPSMANPGSYPKGYCTLIRNHIWNDIVMIGALNRFKKKGGVMKRISGIQHGRYFQNAIQAGSLWIDVANDTVDIGKPPIEVCALSDSGFENISDLGVLGDVLESYWGYRVYPNVFFPEIAPLCPVVAITDNGTLELLPLNHSGIAMNVILEFKPAEDFIFRSRFSSVVLPPEYRDLIERHFHCAGASAEVLAGEFANLRKPEKKESLKKLIGESIRMAKRFNTLKLRPAMN